MIYERTETTAKLRYSYKPHEVITLELRDMETGSVVSVRLSTSAARTLGVLLCDESERIDDNAASADICASQSAA